MTAAPDGNDDFRHLTGSYSRFRRKRDGRETGRPKLSTALSYVNGFRAQESFVGFVLLELPSVITRGGCPVWMRHNRQPRYCTRTGGSVRDVVTIRGIPHLGHAGRRSIPHPFAIEPVPMSAERTEQQRRFAIPFAVNRQHHAVILHPESVMPSVLFGSRKLLLHCGAALFREPG